MNERLVESGVHLLAREAIVAEEREAAEAQRLDDAADVSDVLENAKRNFLS